MEILLTKNELLDLGDRLQGNTVICEAGHCWLTLSGDSRDHLLSTGQRFNISLKGQLVITATADCRLRLVAEQKAVNAGSPWQPLICSRC